MTLSHIYILSSFPFSLARPKRSRAPKFPLPLLTPATQANLHVLFINNFQPLGNSGIVAINKRLENEVSLPINETNFRLASVFVR